MQALPMACLWLMCLLVPARLMAAPVGAGGKAQIRVIAPPDGVWVTEQKLFLAGAVENANVKEISIKGVKAEAKGGTMAVDGGAFGTTVRLDKGKNVITLSAGKMQTSITVYYVPKGEAQKPQGLPKGTKRFYVHANPTVLNCKECHRLKRGEFDFKRVVPARANCTTAKCHSDMGKAAHVHGPVGAGVCISCHSPHGSLQPLELERTGQKLCLVCHQTKQEEFNKKIVHAPVQEGCVDCHDPHESPMRFQLRGDGSAVSSLCFKCHEQNIFTKSHRHGPVAVGDCIACHRPHASDYASLLIDTPEGGKVCFQCHQDRKDSFNQRYVHFPVTENCNQCHDPHSSDARFQLHVAGGELCKTCHEALHPEVYNDIESAKYKHPPVAEGRCTDCHNAHSSNYQPLLKNSMERLCLSCHTDLGDEIAGSKYKHGPVQTGDCTSCHKVHGSEFVKLLIRYYPTQFYSEYSSDKYDLCFGCHNKDIAKKKFTTTLTNFRDGEYNLHFFHVNMKKGRTCTACHDPHASNQAKHIRYEVPFGAWSYPISFTKRDTGGTCVVGCHSPKTYDRKNPQITPSR